MTEIIIIAVLVLAYGLTSHWLENKSLTVPMVFVLAVLLLGQGVLGFIERDINNQVMFAVGIAALTIMLFSDAARMDLRHLRRSARLPSLLQVIALPLTIFFGAVVANGLFPEMTFWAAAIIGVLLSPRVSLLISSVIVNPRLPAGIRRVLIVQFSKRQWMIPVLQRLGLLVLAFVAYGLSANVGGNGLIAEFVAGLATGYIFRRAYDFLLEFAVMGDSAMLFRVHWSLETYSEKRRVIDRVNIAIQQALDNEGIESPYPTQSLLHHLDKQAAE